MTELTKVRRFEEIVLPHLDAAFNLARWLTRNTQDAEDVVQEAYLRAFKFFDSFRGGDGRAWLMAVVRNTCYTWLRQNRPQEITYSLDAEMDVDSDDHALMMLHHKVDDPAALFAQKADKQMINYALEELAIEFREAIVLREIEGLSYKEIAAIVDVPIGTVMSRLARGRELLKRKILAAYG